MTKHDALYDAARKFILSSRFEEDNATQQALAEAVRQLTPMREDPVHDTHARPEKPNLSGGTTMEQQQNDAAGEVTITAKAGRCAACKDTILDMGVRTGGEWYHNACAPKPAAASAWEEFAERCGHPATWCPVPRREFDEWLAAREKAAVEEAKVKWRRDMMDIVLLGPGVVTETLPSGNVRAVVAPKPDAGRAEGVKCPRCGKPAGRRLESDTKWFCNNVNCAINEIAPAPKPRRAPEVVAREVWDTMPAGCVNDYIEFAAAAVRADRGEV
jgi:hypothetical protein